MHAVNGAKQSAAGTGPERVVTLGCGSLLVQLWALRLQSNTITWPMALALRPPHDGYIYTSVCVTALSQLCACHRPISRPLAPHMLTHSPDTLAPMQRTGCHCRHRPPSAPPGTRRCTACADTTTPALAALTTTRQQAPISGQNHGRPACTGMHYIRPNARRWRGRGTTCTRFNAHAVTSSVASTTHCRQHAHSEQPSCIQLPSSQLCPHARDHNPSPISVPSALAPTCLFLFLLFDADLPPPPPP